MMVGGGTAGFSGVGRVVYTWGSVVTRWILSVHIGVALSWCHWTCLRRDEWGGGGELGHDGRGVRLGFCVSNPGSSKNYIGHVKTTPHNKYTS